MAIKKSKIFFLAIIIYFSWCGLTLASTIEKSVEDTFSPRTEMDFTVTLDDSSYQPFWANLDYQVEHSNLGGGTSHESTNWSLCFIGPDGYWCASGGRPPPNGSGDIHSGPRVLADNETGDFDYVAFNMSYTCEFESFNPGSGGDCEDPLYGGGITSYNGTVQGRRPDVEPPTPPQCPGDPSCPPPGQDVSLTFHVHANCSAENIQNAHVSLGTDYGQGTDFYTNSGGNVTTVVPENIYVDWSASASGYSSAGSSVYTGSGQTVDVTLNRTCGSPPPVQPPPPPEDPTPPPPPPPPPGQPTISAPSCSNVAYTATVNWTGASSGYWVDLSYDDFITFWNLHTAANTVTALTDFSPAGFGREPTQPKQLNPGTTYKVRVFSGDYSPTTSFSVPLCTAPPDIAVNVALGGADSLNRVSADNWTPYTIFVTGTDNRPGTVASNIISLYSMINFQGANGDQTQAKARGYVTWFYADPSWAGQIACTGDGGGYAAKQPVFGSQYIHLVSCNVSGSGTSRIASFVITVDPLFTSPTIDNPVLGQGNDISGWAQSRNFASYPTQDSGWTNSDINFGLVPPSASASCPAGTSAFVASKTLGTLRNDVGTGVGAKFTVGSSPISVSALGRIKFGGDSLRPANTGIHTLKLVDTSTGNSIASTSINMTGGTAGQFKYATLSSPVTLLANTSYYLISEEAAGQDYWYDSDTSATPTSVGTINAPVWGSSGNWNLSGGPNFMYVPVDLCQSAPPDMSGSLSGSSCVISSGASSCPTSLSWSITNPQATPTAITASGMSNINVSNSLATPQSGTQNVTVPYNTRTFYLYNNSVELDSQQVSALCTFGTSWDGNKCAPPIITPPPPPGSCQLRVQTSTGGSVTSGDGFINCTPSSNPNSSECRHDYPGSANITLTAREASVFYQLTGWGGACSGENNVCNFTCSGVTNVSATFSSRIFNFIER